MAVYIRQSECYLSDVRWGHSYVRTLVVYIHTPALDDEYVHLSTSMCNNVPVRGVPETLQHRFCSISLYELSHG